MLTCELCHVRDEHVNPGLAWFVEGPDPIQTIDRCADHAACRRRVEQRGESWPLRDRSEIAA